MTKHLRPYQARAVAELARRLERHRRVVAVAPTGSGKTVIAAALIRKLRAKRVLWLAHRIELLHQARAHLVAAGLAASDVGLLSGPEKTRLDAQILVSSIPMFRNRVAHRDIDLVIVDEAHHVTADSYRAVLDTMPQARVVGLTATPWRLDGRPLGDSFEDLLAIDPIELIADGYIMESIVYGVPKDTAADLVTGLSTSGADYSARRLDAVMRKQPLMANIVREWRRLAEGRPTIVYACTLEHARAIAARFRRAGVTAETLDWSTPHEERAAILGRPGRPGRLALGETNIVVNVGILTEGVDCPPVKCIVLARPTKSLTLYRQMCGRGSRPESPGSKRRPLVLDHAGNVWRHGLPETTREWSLDGRDRPRGEAPVKMCEAMVSGEVCGAMNPIAATECSQCGSPFPITERELQERAAELERIRATEDERRRREQILRALAAKRGLGEDWVRRALEDAA